MRLRTTTRTTARSQARRPARTATTRSTAAVTALAALTLAAGVTTAAVGVPTATTQAAPVQLSADAVAPIAPVEVEAPAADALPAEPLGQPASRSRVVPPTAPKPAPLGELRAPDLVVTALGAVTPAQVEALRAIRGVEAVDLVDAGTVRVGGEDARVLGVDPSTFRAFTPQETAAADALWEAVARGEVAPTFGLQRARALELGGSVAVAGTAELTRRVGAVAAFGLPDVDLVTDRATARALGVAPSTTVLLSAPERGTGALRKAVRAVLGAKADVQVLRAQAAATGKRRPSTYLELYKDSARYCPGMSWTILASIGQVESAHGKHLGPSSAGALGPMQFLPSTWEAYGLDGDGDGEADIMSPFDAVPSAAAYLCRFGGNRGPEGLYDAIFAYNHADWYVKKVLALAQQYEGR